MKLTCICGAAAKDNTKERGRFNRRHPQSCQTDMLHEAAKKHLAECASARTRHPKVAEVKK